MFEIVSTKHIYQGKVINLRADTICVDSSDQVVCREIIEHPGSVAIVAIDADDNVYLVSQYRHAVSRILMEIPAGTLEKGESSFDTAERELREEIGMRADYLVSAGNFYLAPGYSSETMEVYVAKGLSSAPLPRDIDEDITVHKVPFKKLLKQVCAGEFSDIKTVTAILLVTLKKELYKPSEIE